MKKILCYIFLAVSGNSLAQDPNFSQFYNNPIYYNPAMTAINDGLTLRLNARNLWGPIPGRFNTYSAAGEIQTVFKMGLGGHVYSDVAGEALLRTSGLYMTYSYRPVDTKNCIIQAGVGGGFVNKNLDWSKLKFSDQYDETLGEVNSSAFNRPSYNSVRYADFNTGIVARFNGNVSRSRGPLDRFMITLGASLHHLSQPKDAFLGDSDYLPFKQVYHANVNLLFGEVVLAPGVVYEAQNQFRTFSIGTNFVNKPMTFGFWLRNRTAAFSAKQYDSFIFVVGIALPSKGNVAWRAMYNYDFTVSRLKTSSYGSHEVSLVFEFKDKVLFSKYVKSRSVKRRFQCPTGFGGI